MYRLGIEAILGVRRVGNSLQINPCIPKHWPGFELTYRNSTTLYHIYVDNPEGVNQGVVQVLVDGKVLPDNNIPLSVDGQKHEVHILMGHAG
jgi:cyclic beta-1,2-glucan synthetase